jgi:hypothetical protein
MPFFATSWSPFIVEGVTRDGRNGRRSALHGLISKICGGYSCNPIGRIPQDVLHRPLDGQGPREKLAARPIGHQRFEAFLYAENYAQIGRNCNLISVSSTWRAPSNHRSLRYSLTRYHRQLLYRVNMYIDLLFQ